MASLTRSLSAICTALALVLFASITDAQTSASNSLLAQAIQSTLSRRWPPSDHLSWLVLDTASGQVLAQQWPSLDDPIPVGSLTKPFVALAYARTHDTFPHTLCKGTPDLCWLPKGHGILDLQHALAQSCNAYFLGLARQLEPTALQTITQLYNLPAAPPDAAPAILIGLEPAWQIAPVTLARAYTRLANQSENQSILAGMRLATQQGTARALHSEDALAKTGTAPCLHHCLASGDGLVLALTPAANPRILLLVRQHGTTGAATAIVAAQMLHALKVQNAGSR
ncbi:MAG TPA: penicillin-binding transpeptidase domain-containing protein [Edaphobacter sp.]